MCVFSVLGSIAANSDPEGDEFCHYRDTGIESLCPNLNEILFSKQVHGKPRDPGGLSLFVDGGRLKACLKCPTEGQVGFLTLDSLKAVHMTLEKALAEGRVDWRPDRKSRKGS